MAGCLLLLVGAFAKSAQVPLHTWLPDAMEGPTPVSALIHAATMVTAGVYLIARMHPLFEQAPAAADVGAIVGCATLLIAATIGLVVTDLKRVIAYSTMSQIGYMVMGVSSFAYAGGLFHLMTHAFFKALLFMAAGSVIAAMGNVQNLDRMSGFKRVLPFTYGCMIVGGLALSGIPPFSGFWSKDEILALLMAQKDWHIVLAVLGYVGAFMTAIYTFRMIFRAFYGEHVRGGARARARAHGAPRPGEPDDRRAGGHRRRLPRPRPPHRRADRPDARRDGRARRAGDDRRPPADPGASRTRCTTSSSRRSRDSPVYEDDRAVRQRCRGAAWLVGAADRRAGHLHRLPAVGRRSPSARRASASSSRRCTASSSTSGTSTRLIDFLVIRPFAWFGRWGRNTFERVVVNGAIVGGAAGAVRAGSAAVRAIQSGYLRYYAALLLLGLAGLGLYFLISAS